MNALERLEEAILGGNQSVPKVRIGGPVREVTPSYYRVAGVSSFVKLGDRLGFEGKDVVQVGEVVRIDDAGVTIKPFEGKIDATLGSYAYRLGAMGLNPHPSWKGRVINALGNPIDGLGSLLPGDRNMPVDAEPPAAMTRSRVSRPLKTGVRAIDLFTPICAGQRIGIFAGSGVGKSTLLSMLARCEGFDTIVIALVGERGREVREFLEGPILANRSRAITVVSTGDESPMMRRQAPKTALCIAEYFRDLGESVLLIVDSVTRFAHAARDVALAAGEPAVARGYTPSVFSDLPRLLERAGPGVEGKGAISGVFSVLVDGDDHNDPVADSIRGTLDGHIVLDRAIADQGRYPAINVLGSISRLAEHVWSPEQKELVRRLRTLIARFEDTRDLRLMGGYQPGSDTELDQAVSLVPKIYEALRQDPSSSPSTDAFMELAQVLRQ
ncbi:flagellar protein export ATPase FliI [Microvirga puerhi]|uniref:Flagellum-specific ATP synthase n=1 Tax=Microvirga puerhi TaxID=2876078 RepID=A0ABS7VW45_9HYPH|nr:flagellar protein export ATPase FliI [Microvirga puerhi]MBZ6079345.1 flagellar protein export ATPase FliI [Microvirga puerhi]